MVERRLISEDERELYCYGIQLLSEKLLGLCSMLIICILAGRVLQGAVFYLTYSLLRKYAGGYHAGRFITCYLSSCGAVLFCVLLSYAPFANVASVIMTVISVPFIFALAPVGHPSRPLEKCEKVRYRKLTCIITVCELCIYSVLFVFKAYSLCFCMGYAFFMMGVMLLVQTLCNKKYNQL